MFRLADHESYKRFFERNSNSINNIHVEKLLEKVKEFENLSTQIWINLDL